MSEVVQHLTLHIALTRAQCASRQAVTEAEGVLQVGSPQLTEPCTAQGL